MKWLKTMETPLQGGAHAITAHEGLLCSIVFVSLTRALSHVDQLPSIINRSKRAWALCGITDTPGTEKCTHVVRVRARGFR